MIYFSCPICKKSLHAPEEKAGAKTNCPQCRQRLQVPVRPVPAPINRTMLGEMEYGPSGLGIPPPLPPSATPPPAASIYRPTPPQGENSHGQSSLRSPIGLILSIGLSSLFLTALTSTILLLCRVWIVGAVMSVLSVFIAYLLLKALIAVYSAKARAIRSGDREVDLFFKCVKLVLWEGNEGLLFLKDKKVSDIIYGPDQGGGMRFIFPIFGEEIKVHVPLTLQMSRFEDHKVTTRESIQLFIKLALWWRIQDRAGLEKFYLLIDKELHLLSDTGVGIKQDFSDGPSSATSNSLQVIAARRSRRAELNAAERWLVTLVESNLRKLVAKKSVAQMISNRATHYLYVERRHVEENSAQMSPLIPAAGEDDGGSPDSLAIDLHRMLAPEAAQYGLELNRIEIQEV